MNLNAVIQLIEHALQQRGLSIQSQAGKHLNLPQGYSIEVEQEQLFKLVHDGQVVAPFDDLDELCDFIKMDMQLNAKS